MCTGASRLWKTIGYYAIRNDTYYKTILSQGGNPQYDSAVVTAGGFTNYTIYYNGQYTVKRKAILAKQIANGVMMWEKWQDAIDGTSLLKAACDTVGRPY